MEYLNHSTIKPTKWHVRPATTQISLGIRLVWSEYSLSARRKLGSLATHWTYSEDSDQTGQMPRLIWVFAERTVILLVLSWGGSFQVIMVDRRMNTYYHIFALTMTTQIYMYFVTNVLLTWQLWPVLKLNRFCFVLSIHFTRITCTLKHNENPPIRTEHTKK